MTSFLQRRASVLIEEARKLAARGEEREACERLLATHEFLERSFERPHRQLHELFQLLSDVYHTLDEPRQAEHCQTQAWEFRHAHEREVGKLLAASGLSSELTLATADRQRWPPQVETLVGKVQHDELIDSPPEAIIFGPAQSGKTHLLHALGHLAVDRPLTTRLQVGHELLEPLVTARRERTSRRGLLRLDRWQVLLVDELDPWNLSSDESEALHRALLHRRDRRCTMLAIRTRDTVEPVDFLASLRQTAGLRNPSPRVLLVGLRLSDR